MRSLRRFLRGTRAAAIVEFALVVPMFALLLLGIIQFSRAYGRMNALTASLREGARKGSTLDPAKLSNQQMRDSTMKRIVDFSTSFGYTVDTSRVGYVSTAADVTVSVTNYPLFAGLNLVGGLSSMTLTRSAVFRSEYAN
jgi:Flp pilus assembly protein TadG